MVDSLMWAKLCAVVRQEYTNGVEDRNSLGERPLFERLQVIGVHSDNRSIEHRRVVMVMVG